jgi:GT2 family glycosyltransferase
VLPTVFVHILTHNSSPFVAQTLAALKNQSGFSLASNLIVELCDNASQDESAECAARAWPEIRIERLEQNLGFSAGHNRGVRRFLNSCAEYLLILNPDLALAAHALESLVQELHARAAVERIGMATPRLYRGDDTLNAVVPARIDAAGMVVTAELRHLDRGSQQPDSAEFTQPHFVFGGTGACLLLSRACVEGLLLYGPKHDHESERIYPQLHFERELRAPLFDEGFFAYREDADLAWRAQWLGWRCRYVPAACGVHRRVVLPERRVELPALFNAWSVRNRFLLQINNLPLIPHAALFWGVLVRNLLVLFGVLFVERQSLSALREVLMLFPRALERRQILMSRARITPQKVMRWFNGSYVE